MKMGRWSVATLLIAPAIVLTLVGAMMAEQDGRAAPQDVLREALRMHSKHDGFSMLRPLSPRPSDERLRGLTMDEATNLLASCDSVDDWNYLGLEESAASDCSRYGLFECRRNSSSMVARVWLDRGTVDRFSELSMGSDFLACRTGQCPDFALGEPVSNNAGRCETRFKIQETVKSR